MGIPDYLLPHAVTRVRPAVTTDSYNNDVFVYDPDEGALELVMKAWMQQDQRTQMSQENIARQGRYPAEERWLLISNDDDVRWQDRILWDDLTFEVYAEPEKTYSPAGYHHLEATLRIVQG
jgi:hypothetical protein